MPTYYVFAGQDFYPRRGALDCVLVTDDLEAAKAVTTTPVECNRYQEWNSDEHCNKVWHWSIERALPEWVNIAVLDNQRLRVILEWNGDDWTEIPDLPEITVEDEPEPRTA